MTSKKEDLLSHLEPMNQSELSDMVKAVVAGYQCDEKLARGLIDSSNGRIRAAAYSALVRMDRISKIDIIRALADPAIEVRLFGANEAIRHPGVNLVEYLEAEKDLIVLEAIVFALGERGDPSCAEIISKIAIEHPDPLCREAAIAALANFSLEESLSLFLQAMSDKAPIRRRVAIALAGYDSERATQGLRTLSKDRDWQTATIARELLAIEDGTIAE